MQKGIIMRILVREYEKRTTRGVRRGVRREMLQFALFRQEMKPLPLILGDSFPRDARFRGFAQTSGGAIVGRNFARRGDFGFIARGSPGGRINYFVGRLAGRFRSSILRGRQRR